MAVHDMLMAAAGGTAGAVNWIDDCFSSYLYTGNGSTQTITNGIDLATKGGMVWGKVRSVVQGHIISDTVTGKQKGLATNSTSAQYVDLQAITSFNNNGFTVGTTGEYNFNGATIVSWTFRKQAKFFDVVTYTGTGSARTVAHNLGSVPGCIIVKRTDTTADWQVYHRSLANTEYMVLNTTAAKATGATRWNSTTPTSSVFSLGTDTTVNASGGTYVAYLFAHDAGGFGDNGDQSVISCGSLTTDGSGNATVTLGWEPQLIIAKKISSTGNWVMYDTMRGWDMSGSDRYLLANSNGAEATYPGGNPTPTGFYFTDSASSDYIYIAIRRPMKPPTTGTEVYDATTWSYSSAPVTVSYNMAGPTDLTIDMGRDGASWETYDRLRGSTQRIRTNSTAAESSAGSVTFNMNSITHTNSLSVSNVGNNVQYFFRRAPGFFDVVCYTGNGGGLGTTVPHNLGVKPELIIVKARDASGNWWVGHKDVFYDGTLNLTDAWDTYAYSASIYFSTSTQLSTAFNGNTNGVKFVAYLFASCPGVSKVGSYTGTGTTQQINCGFSGGARFVLIKRTDSTGDWYVWDTARGIVSGNDPYLLMNSTAAEVTSTDYIDPVSSGFEISSTAPAAINANGGTYIYLAIA